MTLRLRHDVLTLDLRDPFVIARADHPRGRSITTVVVELEADDLPGIVGYGEGYPDAYYGESPESMKKAWPELFQLTEGFEFELETLGEARAALDLLVADWAAALPGNGAAKCALDIACHDLAAKALGISLHELLGLPPDGPPTDFSLGIDEPAVVAERAARAADFPALKIKVGGPADLETLRAVREVYGGPLRVDANTGWSPDDAEAMLAELVQLGVELIEQPFPADRLDQLRELQKRSPLPLVADESCVVEADLDALVGVTAGVNVKLAKAGGVGAAARMLVRARELGFRTFLGCMEETSVGIAASAAVASLAEWVDLDGNLLIARDPFSGLELGPDKRWRLPATPGLGLERRVP
ncbi:MAG: dipeptide epimerase [Chloroflexi bacterium]|nr:dipeptide epimerase [Chloroflexota bacterium]